MPFHRRQRCRAGLETADHIRSEVCEAPSIPHGPALSRLRQAPSAPQFAPLVACLETSLFRGLVLQVSAGVPLPPRATRSSPRQALRPNTRGSASQVLSNSGSCLSRQSPPRALPASPPGSRRSDPLLPCPP